MIYWRQSSRLRGTASTAASKLRANVSRSPCAQRSFDRLEPYIDPKLSLMMELKVDTLPTTILYDAEGREVWRMTGMEDWEGKRAAGLLQEATEG